jgi:DNA-binding GntR family transcriptional regulator
MQSIKHKIKSAPELVRDQLREEIFSGQLIVGQQLRQDEIAERFGTSRIPVREALRQLESEHLITYQPNKGAIVKGLSIQEVLQMFDIRIALECHALKLAIPHMAEEDLATAEDILQRYQHCTDPTIWGEMNWRFHWCLYEPCNRDKLLNLIEANYGHLNRYARTQISLSSGKEQPQEEHFVLLSLCREGKTEKAVQFLYQHIEKAQKSLHAKLRKGKLRSD